MNKAHLITHWQELPWSEIKLKANKHLPTLIFIFLIILVTQLLAELTWSIFEPEQDSASIVTKSEVKTSLPVNTSRLHDVSEFHLFGNAKQAPSEQKVIDAPETRLRLDLKGVFASSNASQALAIISSSKGKDKTYHIGDKIIGGALLHAVYADRVILKRDGKLETLRLPKPKVDTKNLYSKKALNSVNSAVSINLSQSENKQKLRELRDTLLKDPSKIWKKVRISPVLKDGKVAGYSFVHNDQSLMSSLGIRKTDVILAVNGESLSDPSSLYGLMGTLSQQQTIELTVERDGQQQSILLSF